MRVVLALLALASLPAQGEAPCPARDAASQPSTPRALAAQAAVSTASSDPSCQALGFALFAQLESHGSSACAAAERLRAGGLGSDAAAAAYEALLSWRCGRARHAHARALAALDRDPELALAWLVLGRVLEARFRPDAARVAYEEALARAPEHSPLLIAMARVTGNREERKAWLGRYLQSAGAEGEALERLSGARDNLELLEVLGERPLWQVLRWDLPAQLRVRPLAERAGDLRGLLLELRIGRAKRVPTLFDTGASGLHLARRTARRGGLEALDEARLFGGGGSGEHAVTRGIVAELDLGPVLFGEALGVGASGSLHPRGSYRAILGADLFTGTTLTLDPKRWTLSIEELDPESDELEAELDPRRIDPWPQQAEALPLLRVEGQLLVPVHIDDGEPRELLLLLDTGATRTMLAEDAAAASPRFRVRGSRAGRGYGGRIPFVGEIASARLRVGEVQAELRELAVLELSARTRLSGIRVGGYLGLDVLTRQRMILDLARGELSFETATRSSR